MKDDVACNPSPESSILEAGNLPTDRFPATDEEADIGDSLLAKDFQNLSVQEREKCLHDIHGIVEVQREDPAVIEQHLANLQLELAKIRDSNDDLRRALHMNRGYVCSTKFQLMFLRKECFDVSQAAESIARHFEVKRKLFGDGEVLSRPVFQSDLGAKATAILKSGMFLLLPTRDNAGRAIFLVQVPAVADTRDEVIMDDYRVIWYLLMKCLEDEASENYRGVVWIANSLTHDNALEISLDQLKGLRAIQTAIPMTISSEHLCYKNPAMRPYLVGVQMFATNSQIHRTRVHFGTQQEIIPILQTFGIPAEQIPWSQDNSHDTVLQHQIWLHRQQAKEMLQLNDRSLIGTSCVVTIEPSQFDVLFGRTVFARGHPGTVRALKIVEDSFEDYEKLGRYEKMDMADKIVRDIQETGGRFLRQNEGGLWLEVDKGEARKKVAHWFRRRREGTAGGGSNDSRKIGGKEHSMTPSPVQKR